MLAAAPGAAVELRRSPANAVSLIGALLRDTGKSSDAEANGAKVKVGPFGDIGPLPIVEDCRNLTPDSLTGHAAIGVLRQQLVIVGVGMTDMGNHSEADRLRAELFGRGGAADTAAVLATCMFGNFHLFCSRTPGILLADRAANAVTNS